MRQYKEKRKYVKPSWKVYWLLEPTRILAGSGDLDDPDGYSGGGDPLDL